MIILRKKRIVLIITSIFLGVFMYVFTIDSINNKYEIPTVSLPISEKTIVVDAGHGKPDERRRKFKWGNRSRN